MLKDNVEGCRHVGASNVFDEVVRRDLDGNPGHM